ncbi:AI-2E family transporter [Virgibacillus profundi]|uniref:AI-2E family transporter n=1 Tax=Virgibacillus profundi TaxID=2024555 RepID=A0A2A2IJB7_9BACI|nr:AI-2E family transporter [Virgibacillus profundi]PAV31622.1 AI-2E family transporter [Virgibacillus profundi]PXY55808.1 AI-2E family transporter [Virgibacillus profundi]
MKKPNIIQFLGGRQTLYILGVVLLTGLIILLYNSVSFIFTPVIILISTIALPVLLAIIAYYLLRPLVKLLDKVGIKKIWAILLLFILIAGGLTFGIMSIIPFIIEQAKGFVNTFPNYLEQFITGMDGWLKGSFLAPYYESLMDKNGEFLDSLVSDTSQLLSDTINNLTNIVSTVANVTISLITFPFVLFYLLKDGDRLPKAVLKILPPKMRTETKKVFDRIDLQLKSYIQGQIMVSFCIGIMMYIGFLIIGMDYALILAAIASVTSIVPYLGPTIAITPALIIAIVTSPFMVIKLVIVWTIVQLSEGKFISPQIFGKSLHVHPVTIIFVLLTAGHLFGVFGVILGIPGYAVLRTIIEQLFSLFKKRYNHYFAKAGEEYEIEENGAG